MGDIEYREGDATAPGGEGERIIAHVCNDIGAWSAGFVVALSRRWSEPEAAFRRWYAEREVNDFDLGALQLVRVGPTLQVANMAGQHGIRRRRADGSKPVRYWAIDLALRALGEEAVASGATVHMPRIGCGLAGGEWSEVEPLVRGNLTDRGVPVTVWDLPATG